MLGKSVSLDIKKEHAIETYKALIQMGSAGIKFASILNGGAAVALLSYLGNVAGKGASVPDMRLPMGCYIVGLVFCGLAYIASYFMQLALYNESWQTIELPQEKSVFDIIQNIMKGEQLEHKVLLKISIGLAFSSLFAFAFGSFQAVLKFY
jgi:hypothetical protein